MRPRTLLSLLAPVALACSADQPTDLKPEFVVGCQIAPIVLSIPSGVTLPPQTAAVATFSVKNRCTLQEIFRITASRTGSVSAVSTPNPVHLGLSAMQTKNVTVPFTTGAPGTGAVNVVATNEETPTVSSPGTLPVTVTGTSTGIPFGLAGLVVGPTVTPGPWTGAIGCCRDPNQTLQQLSDARAHHIKMWFYGVSHDSSTGTNGDFDAAKWKLQFDKFASASASYQTYVGDGTFQGILLLDDVLRPGWSVSFAELEDIAAYAEARIKVPTAVRLHASDMPAGTYVNVDLAWNQYSARLGDVTAYRDKQISAGASKSLGLVFGLNVINGGVQQDKRPAGDTCWPGTVSNDCNMSPAELRNYGGVLGAYSDNCAFIMWQNDATYLARSGVLSAMNDLAAQMQAHPTRSCKH